MDRQEFEERCKNGGSSFTAPYVYDLTLESLDFSKDLSGIIDLDDLSDWEDGKGLTYEKREDGKYLRFIRGQHTIGSSYPILHWIQDQSFFSTYMFKEGAWQFHNLSQEGWRRSTKIVIDLDNGYQVDFRNTPEDEALSRFQKPTHEEKKALVIRDLLPVTFFP